jgi:hypothetical protein
MKATPTPAMRVFEEFDPADRRSEYAFLTRKAYIRDVTDAIEELKLEPRTIATCGEWVVVDVKISGYASGVALETNMTRCPSRLNGGQPGFAATRCQRERPAMAGRSFKPGLSAPPDDLGP